MKILMTGATGHLGGAVIDQLLKKMDASDIFALTRDPESDSATKLKAKRVSCKKGNYDDTDLLEKALQGLDTVLLISAGNQGDRMQQHKNVVDSAKKAGVENIAYTSRSLKDRDTLVNDLMKEHFLTEDYIEKSGLNYTIFRNALYMYVLPMFVGQKVFVSGIHQPAGQGKVAYALRSEQGEAMANVLAENDFSGKTYRFTANDAYTFDDVAKAWSELSGKTWPIPMFPSLPLRSRCRQKISRLP